MSNIISPLVKDGKCKFLRTFNAIKIIQLYSDDIGLDVSRFFIEKDEIKLYQCVTTGYRFYYPFTTIGDSKFYKDIASVRQTYYSERWEHKHSLKYIQKDDKLLEIGSGFGSFLNLIMQNGINDVRGLEFSPLAIKTCKEKGLNVDGILIEDVAKEDLKYDVVCSFQVLEHITDVNSFIQSSIEALNTGGKIIIGVPNNNPYIFVNDDYHTLNLPPHHAGLWTSSTFKSLENVFPIKQINIEFEPLSKSMDYFLKLQKSNSNFYTRNFYKTMDRIFKSYFRRLLSKLINGRNILVVFEKL